MKANHWLDSLILGHKVFLNCKGKNVIVHVFFAKESYLTKKPKSGNLS